MAVGDYIACHSVPGNRSIIIRNLHFLYGVGNLLPICVSIQLCKAICPLVPFAQGQCLSCILSVRQQLHCDALRTDSILVIVILPGLGHSHTGLSWGIAVCYIIPINCRSVILHCILGDCVVDLHAILILRQVREAPGPTVISSHCLCFIFQFCTVGIQTDSNGFRAFTVLVLCIIPGLRAGNVYSLRCMAVGDYITLGGISSDYCIISCYFYFFNCINNLLAICILIQVCKAIFPPVPFAQSQCLSCILSVRQQPHCDALRTDSILVIVILPGLGHSHTGLSWGIAVCYIIPINCRSVILHCILEDCIVNLHAILILRQVREAPFPTVIFSHCLRFIFQFCTVGIQTDSDGFRTLSILILCIIPGLCSGNVYSLRCMAVGDYIACRSIPGNRSIIIGNLHFLYGVGNLFPICVNIQVCKTTCPPVPFAQGQCLSCILSVRQQLHCDALRTDSILVIVILPGLGHSHTGLSWGIAVCYIIPINCRSVILHCILEDCIVNLHAILILRQVREAPFPTVIFSHCLRFIFQFCTVGIQTDSDGFRTLSILILCIIPGLCSGNVYSLRCMAVSNGIAICSRTGYLCCIFIY